MDSKGPAANPLSHVLSASGEELELIKYTQWNVTVPEDLPAIQMGEVPPWHHGQCGTRWLHMTGAAAVVRDAVRSMHK